MDDWRNQYEFNDVSKDSVDRLSRCYRCGDKAVPAGKSAKGHNVGDIIKVECGWCGAENEVVILSELDIVESLDFVMRHEWLLEELDLRPSEVRAAEMIKEYKEKK
jgi:transcription elongation factor Elf1